VSIEDLGNIVVLFTDKTGTLTEGQITCAAALDADGRPSDAVLRAGLLCNDATFSDGHAIGGNQLDQALWAPVDVGVARIHVGERQLSVVREQVLREGDRVASALVPVHTDHHLLEHVSHS
jgi:magnesium-transporting ATPase (P-type)